MSKYITPSLVEQVCANSVQNDPVAPCSWDAIDPGVKAMLRVQATAFLEDVIPALLNHQWIPPEPITDIPF